VLKLVSEVKMQPSPVDIGGYWNMYHANAGGIGEKGTI